MICSKKVTFAPCSSQCGRDPVIVKRFLCDFVSLSQDLTSMVSELKN